MNLFTDEAELGQAWKQMALSEGHRPNWFDPKTTPRGENLERIRSILSDGKPHKARYIAFDCNIRVQTAKDYMSSLRKRGCVIRALGKGDDLAYQMEVK